MQPLFWNLIYPNSSIYVELQDNEASVSYIGSIFTTIDVNNNIIDGNLENVQNIFDENLTGESYFGFDVLIAFEQIDEILNITKCYQISNVSTSNGLITYNSVYNYVLHYFTSIQLSITLNSSLINTEANYFALGTTQNNTCKALSLPAEIFYLIINN